MGKAVRFLARNKNGMAAGMAYSTSSFIMFVVGLGYGAGCPEAGPEICNTPATDMMRNSIYFITPHTLSWGLFHYSAQQVYILLTASTHSPINAPVTGQAFFLIPLFSFSAALALWAFVGAACQQLARSSHALLAK